MIMNMKQKKIKIEPRIKLNYNIYAFLSKITNGKEYFQVNFVMPSARIIRTCSTKVRQLTSQLSQEIFAITVTKCGILALLLEFESYI